MVYTKDKQMDFDGLELVADYFTGAVSGAVSGALTGSAATNITVTPTSGSLPTANGAITIADTSTPTVVELLEYCTELNAKIIAIQAALD